MKTLKFKTESILLNAEELVLNFCSPYMDVEHLLLSLITNQENNAYKLLKKLGINLHNIKSALERELKSRKTDKYDMSPVSQRVFKVLDFAQDFAKRMGKELIDGEHILLGILKENTSFASKILYENGINIETILNEVK